MRGFLKFKIVFGITLLICAIFLLISVLPTRDRMEVIYDGKVVHEFVDISLASNFKSGDGVQTVKVQPSAVDQLKKLSIDYLHKVVSIRINANQPVNVIISSVIDSGLFVIHLADGKNNNEKPKVFNSKEEATQDLLDTFVPGPKGGN